MDPNLPNMKYGVLPPLRTHVARAPDGRVLAVATYIPEGYSMEEWRANLPHAWAALEATLTPEQRAAIRRVQAEHRRAERQEERRAAAALAWPPPTSEERLEAQFARERLRRQRRSRRKRRRARPRVRRLGDDD